MFKQQLRIKPPASWRFTVLPGSDQSWLRAALPACQFLTRTSGFWLF